MGIGSDHRIDVAMRCSGSLSGVKLLRIAFLIVLAALLPVRGALATALLHPPAGHGPHGELRLVDHGGSAAHTHAHAHAMDAVAHAGGGMPHGQGDGCPDESRQCTSSCAASPMVSAAALAEPRDLADAAFPEPALRAPSFLSDGQERPPRSP